MAAGLEALLESSDTRAISGSPRSLISLLKRFPAADKPIRQLLVRCANEEGLPDYLRFFGSGEDGGLKAGIFFLIRPPLEERALILPVYRVLLQDPDPAVRKIPLSEVSRKADADGMILQSQSRGDQRLLEEAFGEAPSPEEKARRERCRANRALVEEVLPDLSGLLLDRDVGVRREALAAAGKISSVYGSTPPVPVLVKAKFSEDPKVRTFAMAALGETDPARPARTDDQASAPPAPDLISAIRRGEESRRKAQDVAGRKAAREAAREERLADERYVLGEREDERGWLAKKAEFEELASLKWRARELLGGREVATRSDTEVVLRRIDCAPGGYPIGAPREKVAPTLMKRLVDSKREADFVDSRVVEREWMVAWNQATPQRGDTIVYKFVGGKLAGWIDLPPPGGIEGEANRTRALIEALGTGKVKVLDGGR